MRSGPYVLLICRSLIRNLPTTAAHVESKAEPYFSNFAASKVVGGALTTYYIIAFSWYCPAVSM